jgi:hypothetical protein
MQEQSTQPSDTTVDANGDVRMWLGEATELTLGSGDGRSEDKRYLYN